MAKNVYAVRKGRKPGLYETWAECSQQINGFSGANYQGFKSREAALDWLNTASTEFVDIDTNPKPRSQQSTVSSSNVYLKDLSEKLTASNAVEDISSRRCAKAEAFAAYLSRHGVPAKVCSHSAPYYHRIDLKSFGYIDLYLTHKNPYDLHCSNVKNDDLQHRVLRLWRMFVWGVTDERSQATDKWRIVDYYYERLRPFARLNFDFFLLAKALERATDDAPPADLVRFDFDRIEAAYLQLRFQHHE